MSYVYYPFPSFHALNDISVSDEIWQDDFSTDTINRYTVTGPDNGKFGNWQVTDGKLQVTGTAAATNWWTTTLLLSDTSYDNFVMEFDAEVSTGYGVFFRGEDNGRTLGSGYNKWFGGNTYLLMHHNPVDASNGEYMALYQYGGSQKLIKKFDVEGSMGALKKVHWVLAVRGGSIIVTVSDLENSNNRYTYTIEDATYTAGSIGFYNNTRSGVTSLKIDNLTVTPLNALYENDFSNTETISDFFTAGPDAGAWGNWQVAGNKLQVTGNTGASWWGTSAFVSQKYDNFVMEFDAVSTAGYGLIFRASNKEGLNSWFGGDGYCAMHWNPTDATNGRYAELYDYSGKETYSRIEKYCEIGQMASMSNMHWKVVAWKNMITIEISGNNSNKNYIYTVENDKYESGYIGFYSLTYAGNTSLKISNLSINGYKKNQNSDGQNTNEIWQDDFSTDTINRYTVTGPDNGKFGNWQVTDGKLQVTGTAAATNWWTTTLLLSDTSYDNFVMEFDAEVSTGYGVFFRGEDNGRTLGSGYNKWFGGNTYLLMHHNPVDASNGEYMALYQYGGSQKLIKKFDVEGSMGALKKVHWVLAVRGGSIIVTVSDLENSNNRYTYTIEDATYTAGSIGFYNNTRSGVTSLKIDNLTVTPLNALYENDFSNTETISDFFTAGPDAGAWGNWQVAGNKLQVTGNTGASWWDIGICQSKI